MGGWILFIAKYSWLNALWDCAKKEYQAIKNLIRCLEFQEAKKRVVTLKIKSRLLDSKIGSLNGVKKMVSDWEEALNGVRIKISGTKKALETMYESIKSIMHDSGIQIDSTKTKKLNRWHKLLLA